ncbi:zinc-ribbon domain-containing protein [Enterocloster asparagiformis]|uniref:Zinc-ribbon domain-containing protein n=1 Tax=Enterocloster asparagiformis TaxID=333367 RepID=A0A413FLM4_9FIRM|nr:zinc-ribbon domain-containing protein [Enterocloster asparagiformis]RGX33212.1 zinc-ribbon domain-containing protein [Enterocloster asparagiformis]
MGTVRNGITDRKQLLRHLTGALFFLMILFKMAGTAFGEEQSRELMVLPRQAHIVVSIGYETEMPDITLISPDGTAYSEAAGNVRVEHGENTAFYFLPDALAGQWLIRFDKKSNPAITADYAEYTPDLTIDSLVLKGVSGSQAEISFHTSYAKDVTYNYVVYAVLLDENRNVTGQKELDHGTARTGQEENRRISLSNLSSYENYYLELEVYLKEYGLETYDTRITDQNFGYVNEHQPEAIGGVKVEIDPAKLLFTMDWSDYKVSCDQYLAAFYTAASPDTPLSYQSVESGYNSVIFDLPSDVHAMTVELTYIRNGVASAPYRRQIDWEKGLILSIDTPENTNSAQAVITYETDAQRNAVISVNETSQQVVLTGSDSISIQLEEFSNEVSVRCALDDMTDVIYRKSIYSDRIAPVLRFYEKVDAISVEEDHFLLTGETEPGCKLTVNGTEYPMNEDGSFLADLPLEKDENVFSVISTDPAGNQSAQNVTIYHGDVPAAAAIAAGQNGDGDGMGYLPMFFTMLIGMSVVLTVILTGVVLGKRRALIRGVMTVTTLRNVFLLVTGFLAAAAAFARLLAERARAAAESLAFIRAAQRSPQEAHLMLKDYENLNRIFFVLAAAAGICLASSILFMVLNRALKKRRNAPPGPEGSHRIKHKPRTGQQQPTAPKVTAKTEPKAAPAEPKAVKTGVPAPETAKSAGAVAGAPPQSSSWSAEAAPPQSPSESVADSAAESTNAAPAAPPAVFCPHCGKMIKKSKAMFCPFCGKSLRS